MFTNSQLVSKFRQKVKKKKVKKQGRRLKILHYLVIYKLEVILIDFIMT